MITAADLLNDRVVPFFEEHNVKLLRVITDRGSEFCGNSERHEYELYLAVEQIDHSRKETNGHLRAFPQDGAQRVPSCRLPQEVYRSGDELQADLDLLDQ